jgi:membrane protease YdiL (CAAX protease family)
VADVLLVGLGFALTLAGAAVAFAPSRAGSASMWLAMVLSQVPVAAVSLARMRRANALGEMLQPRWGDISMGVGSALLLLVVTWGARAVVAPPVTAREAWLFRAYLQAGDPAALERNVAPTVAAILAMAVLAEIGWRGLVLQELEERVGSRRAWVVTGLLYGAAFAPSAWLLRDRVGPNPLVVGAAVAGGLVWSFLAARTGRLVPAILSHALYLWFVVAQFRLFAVAGM